MASLAQKLAKGEVLILDGGTGTELERRGVPMHGVAWSGAAVLNHADVLTQVHADYIEAGADVVITNTFATTRYMLEPAGLGARVHEVNTRAVEVAKTARDRASGGRDVWIAGSISSMAPENDPGQRPDLEGARASFAEQAEILADAGADLIVLEMMCDVDYTAAAIEAAAATGLPVWVGFSCRSSPTGEIVMAPGIAGHLLLADVIAPAMAHGGSLLAIMHTDVEDTGPALDVARAHWSGPIAVYPHSGHFAMPHWQFDSVISPEDYLAAAREWVAGGTQVIGGCCGITPEHIRLLTERLPLTLS